MIRLFKLVFVIVILAAAYFSFKQHAVSTAQWTGITTPTKVQLKFPDKPTHAQKLRNLPILGEAKLLIYQYRAKNDLFVYIEVAAHKRRLDSYKLAELESAIFALNDTANMTLTDKKHYERDGFSVLEYVAKNGKDQRLYCRTLKQADRLASILYISTSSHFSKQRHEQFFNSLKWPSGSKSADNAT